MTNIPKTNSNRYLIPTLGDIKREDTKHQSLPLGIKKYNFLTGLILLIARKSFWDKDGGWLNKNSALEYHNRISQKFSDIEKIPKNASISVVKEKLKALRIRALASQSTNKSTQVEQSAIPPSHDTPDFEGMTPLMKAAAKEDSAELLELLESPGDVDAKNLTDDCKSALIFAIIAKNLTSVQALLKKGAKADLSDSSQKTPLMYAAELGSVDVINELIHAEAKLNFVNIVNFVNFVNFVNADSMTALMFAAKSGSVDVINELIRAEAKLNILNDQGMTALMFAVKSGSIPAVKALLAANADSSIEDLAERTAKSFAEKSENREMIELFP